MIIETENYLDELKKMSYVELFNLRNEVLEDIKAFECDFDMQKGWDYMPSPDVFYQMNLKKLAEILPLMGEAFRNEYESGEKNIDDYYRDIKAAGKKEKKPSSDNEINTGNKNASSIRIEKKGIVSIPADAIVNAANSGLWAGGGVCGVIFDKAGEDELTAACKKIGHCDEGSAVITPGFKCPSKYIIHAVGPDYRNGSEGKAELLYGAYKKSLELCLENDIHSVVFPLLSAGIFKCPLNEAWSQAIYACKNFINKNQNYKIDIIFAIPEDEKIKAGNAILQKELANINL